MATPLEMTAIKDEHFLPHQVVPYTVVRPPTNVLAIVSLVSSLSTIITGFGFIVGIITGHLAVRQIQERGEAGLGIARAGLISGYVCLTLVLALAAVLVAGVLIIAQG